MKKLFIVLFIVPIMFCFTACSAQKPEERQKIVQSEEEREAVSDNPSGFATETADVWTPTFQLCWNELADLLGTKEVTFVDETPEIAKELNKKKFKKEDLSEKDYYISVSKQTLEHKNEIEKVIKEKFNEKSDILDKFEFKNVSDDQTDMWFIYSILIKNFPFISNFEVLEPDFFNKNEDTKYKYFGSSSLNTSKDLELLKSTEGLFYENDDDFALKIEDKTGTEEMILYLNDTDKSFDELYAEITERTDKREDYQTVRVKEIKEKYTGQLVGVSYNNYYKLPYLEIDRTLDYDSELAGKILLSKDKTPFVIDKTIQTIKFKMNEEGAKLKSEAAISVEKSAKYIPIVELNSYYYFDRPFVIFLKEKGKDKPYFAARIKDGKYLVKAE